jgi:hypothetical protein
MSLRTQLHDLLERVAAGLRLLPGVTELYLFGSLTTSQADAYADIDLQLVTADLPLTRANWPYLLEQIQPIDVAWPITPTPDNTAFAVLFHDASYYHKIDIGLSAAVDSLSVAPTLASAVRLWAQEARRFTLPLPSSRAYIPAYGTIGHELIEQLIAGVRYLKARKRGHQFTSWRFMRSQPEKLLYLLHEQTHGWIRQKTSLSTWDYKQLDRDIDKETQEQIMRHLDWSTPRIMDQNFYWFLEQIVHLYKQKASEYSEGIPDQVISNNVVFIRSELGLEDDI